MKAEITTVLPIPAFSDNYIWLLHNGKDAVAIDPGDAAAVERQLTKLQLSLTAILITHHHHDHTGGLTELQNRWQCVVYAPNDQRIDGKLTTVTEAQTIQLEQLNCQFKVLELPGHTVPHIGFYNADWLFCGDVLFSLGCGRMFEGNAEQFYQSLQKIKQLNPKTLVFAGHEYTQSNLDFALHLEPNKPELLNFQTRLNKLRDKQQPSLPSTLDFELNNNPFLRCDENPIQRRIKQLSKASKITQDSQTFALMRQLKDNF